MHLYSNLSKSRVLSGRELAGQDLRQDQRLVIRRLTDAMFEQMKKPWQDFKSIVMKI